MADTGRLDDESLSDEYEEETAAIPEDENKENPDEYAGDEGEDDFEEEEDLDLPTYEIHKTQDGAGILIRAPEEEDDKPSRQKPPAIKSIGSIARSNMKKIEPPKNIETYLKRSPEEDTTVYQMRVEFTNKIFALGSYSADRAAALGSMIAKKKKLKIKFSPSDEDEIKRVLRSISS